MSKFMSMVREAGRKAGPRRRSIRPELESLEERALMSVNVVNGDLYIRQTNSHDQCTVRVIAGKYEVNDNGVIRRFSSAQIWGGDLIYHGLGGDDRFRNASHLCTTAYGGSGNDKLVGGSNDDWFFGGLGNDWLHGRNGHDVLQGQSGNDFILGHDGNDTILGGVGDDLIVGGRGRDHVRGGPGHDYVVQGHVAVPSMQLLDSVKAHLASTLGVDVADVRLARIEYVEWPDSSLGCPEQGVAYLAMVTPGFRIVFEAAGQEYEYHTDTGSRFVLCQEPNDSLSDAPKVFALEAPNSDFVESVKAHLASTLGVDVADVRLARIEYVEWPNSSLGCPEQGVAYLAMVTPGFRIVFEAAGQEYEYHSDAGSRFVLCQK